MSCYYPFIGIPNGRNPNGKINYSIRPFKDSVWRDLLDRPPLLGPPVKIPCGKCIGCRLDYSRQWANRCMLEAQYHPKGTCWFFTITYNNKYVPVVNFMEDGKSVSALTLRKRDFQLWMKRLRKAFCNDKIRFFAAGEYGSETLRPHYHAIIFGLHLNDLESYSTSNNFVLYTSKGIDKTWSTCYNLDSGIDHLVEDSWKEGDRIYEPHGRIVISSCSWETCAYTARYTAKKSNTFFPEFYEKFHLEAPFTLMSRRPGIGRQYYDQHPDLYDYQYINVSGESGGVKFSAPRYFDRLLERDNPELYGEIKETRRRMMEELDVKKDSLSTYGHADQLRVAERQKEASVKMLRRSSV